MREISLQEAAVVSGGNDTINAQVANACEGQPDSAVVTVSYQDTTKFGLAGIAGKEGVRTVTITVKCGDFRASRVELDGGS